MSHRHRVALTPVRSGGVYGIVFLLLAASLPALCAADPPQSPKVRAITGFVTIDRAHYQTQVAAALKVLRGARAAFEKGGYEVQSIRIVTQPFPEYTRGLGREEALAFLRAYDEFAQKEQFEPNLGTAMLHDTDDPAPVELLGEILSTTKKLLASVIVASDDGIHWKSIRATAKMLKYVSEHSPRSQGNFNFAATDSFPESVQTLPFLEVPLFRSVPMISTAGPDGLPSKDFRLFSLILSSWEGSLSTGRGSSLKLLPTGIQEEVIIPNGKQIFVPI